MGEIAAANTESIGANPEAIGGGADRAPEAACHAGMADWTGGDLFAAQGERRHKVSSRERFALYAPPCGEKSVAALTASFSGVARIGNHCRRNCVCVSAGLKRNMGGIAPSIPPMLFLCSEGCFPEGGGVCFPEARRLFAKQGVCAMMVNV